MRDIGKGFIGDTAGVFSAVIVYIYIYIYIYIYN